MEDEEILEEEESIEEQMDDGDYDEMVDNHLSFGEDYK